AGVTLASVVSHAARLVRALGNVSVVIGCPGQTASSRLWKSCYRREQGPHLGGMNDAERGRTGGTSAAAACSEPGRRPGGRRGVLRRRPDCRRSAGRAAGGCGGGSPATPLTAASVLRRRGGRSVGAGTRRRVLGPGAALVRAERRLADGSGRIGHRAR